MFRTLKPRTKRAYCAVKRLTQRAIVLAVGLVFSASAQAFASSSSVAALQTASSGVTTLITALAGLAALILIGICIWDFLKHRDIGRSAIELGAGVVMAAIAMNASSVASTLGVSGAHF